MFSSGRKERLISVSFLSLLLFSQAGAVFSGGNFEPHSHPIQGFKLQSRDLANCHMLSLHRRGDASR